MRKGRRAASPFGNTVSRWPISRMGFSLDARVVEADVDGIAEGVVRLAGGEQAVLR